MKYLNAHRDLLESGRKLSHAGFVYWKEDNKIYRRTCEAEIEKREEKELVGLMAFDGTIRRTGNKVKSLREAAGMSVAELAKRTGLARNTLVNYDLNQRHISKAAADIVYKISKVFGVTMEELIEEDMRNLENANHD